MGKDLAAELDAMTNVGKALSELDEEAQARVLQWAVSRFGGGGGISPNVRGYTAEAGSDAHTEVGPDAGEQQFSDLASLYDAANPGSEAEKALVCAYWFQEMEGYSDLTAQAVNTELKHLGHGVGNITRAFERLKGRKPALIVQTRKEGKSQQARKRFKLTGEGKKAVMQMLDDSG